MICKSEYDGVIKVHKHVYFPDYNNRVVAPSKSEEKQEETAPKRDVVCDEDIPAIVMAIESKKIHMLAINQIESREDVKLVRQLLGNKGKNIKILAKI